MRKLISLAVVAAVLMCLTMTTMPLLAEGNGQPDQGTFIVAPTRGGIHDDTVFTPPGAPTVTIPLQNPAIGPDGGTNQSDAQPGDVFWVISQDQN